MTQIFTERGTVVPVTVLQADGCRVVQRKSNAVDGYEAVQIGIGQRLAKRTPKPLAGHFKRAGIGPLRTLRELRDPSDDLKVGSKLEVDIFIEGQRVDVIGVSKGKGFSGQHKRHNFHRGPVTHGSHNIKQPGSIGSTDAARVFKGLRMAGHLGHARATVRNLEVVRVDKDRNLLLIKGAVPGHANSVVLVRDSERTVSSEDE